tara:strand:- start:431 stop:586 length:156 start_codon:yes stop_codon:yes gene_type:complete
MVMLKRGVKKITYSNEVGTLCSQKLQTLETTPSGGLIEGKKNNLKKSTRGA